MKFIYIKFSGGMGNQLFQYATARALMKKGDFLLFDTGNYRNDYLGRQFGLLNYNVAGRVVKSRIVRKIFTPETKLNVLVSSVGVYGTLREGSSRLHSDLQSKASFLTFMQGYWQSASYFDVIRPLLLDEFIPLRKPSSPLWLREANTVAVGVRRADYLVDSRYGFIGEEYYFNAMKLVREKLSNPLFVIFTDDAAWCRNFFKNENCVLCEEQEWQRDYLKLYLIANCSHQIVSNSTFYWWGAWLNKNPDKIVVRPSHPFNDMRMLYESHFPREWLVVDNSKNQVGPDVVTDGKLP